MPTSGKLVGGTPSASSIGVEGVEQVVDATFGASRISLRPTDYIFQGKVLGHYRIASVTGAILASSTNDVMPFFSFRWGNNSSAFAVIERISVGWALSTAFITQTSVIDADCIILRQFTAVAGGTLLLPSTTSALTNMVSSTMNQSMVAAIRISTTGTLGNTGTLDDNPFGCGCFNYNNHIGEAVATTDIYKVTAADQHPLVIGTNEGFTVRIITGWIGGTGVGSYYVTIDWAEVSGY